MAIITDILNGDAGLAVRNKLNSLIKAYNSIISSDGSFNVLRINASFVKDATPTNTKFLRDDGTWQTVNTAQTLEQTVTNGGTVTGSDNTTVIFEIDKSNDLINVKTPTYFHDNPVILGEAVAKVVTLDVANRIVSSGINVADIATKAYAEGLVAGLLDDRGSYDASTNTFPSTGGSGTSGAILKGDFWYISVAGTLGGQAVTIGDSVRALTDAPAQVATNWSVLETNIGYVPENVSNKATSMVGNTTSNIIYLSAKAIYDWAIALFQPLLVSGTNIKTVNGTSLLGSGNVVVKSDFVPKYSGKWYSYPYINSASGINGLNNCIVAIPIPVGEAHYVTDIRFRCTTAVAGGNTRVALYTDNNGYPDTLIEESGNIDCSTTGEKVYTFTAPILLSGQIIYAVYQTSSTTIALLYSTGSFNLFERVATSIAGNTLRLSPYTYQAMPSTFPTGGLPINAGFGIIIDLKKQ